MARNQAYEILKLIDEHSRFDGPSWERQYVAEFREDTGPSKPTGRDDDEIAKGFRLVSSGSRLATVVGPDVNERMVLDTYTRTINATYGGDVTLDNWPDEVDDLQREWITAFTKEARAGTVAATSPETYQNLQAIAGLLDDIEKRLVGPNPHPSLVSLSVKLREASNWLKTRI